MVAAPAGTASAGTVATAGTVASAGTLTAADVVAADAVAAGTVAAAGTVTAADAVAAGTVAAVGTVATVTAAAATTAVGTEGRRLAWRQRSRGHLGWWVACPCVCVRMRLCCRGSVREAGPGGVRMRGVIRFKSRDSPVSHRPSDARPSSPWGGESHVTGRVVAPDKPASDCHARIRKRGG